MRSTIVILICAILFIGLIISSFAQEVETPERPEVPEVPEEKPGRRGCGGKGFGFGRDWGNRFDNRGGFGGFGEWLRRLFGSRRRSNGDGGVDTKDVEFI